MIDREKMIRTILEAEDGPALKMAYGFLQGVREDTEERRRSGNYEEPELSQRERAAKYLLSIKEGWFLKRIYVSIRDYLIEKGEI